MIIANNDYLKDYEEYARKFVKATARGYEYAIANPREAADILMEEKEVLKGEYKADASQWGYIDQARWDTFFDLMWELRTEGMTGPISDGYGFTNSFLPA